MQIVSSMEVREISFIVRCAYGRLRVYPVVSVLYTAPSSLSTM